MRKKPKMYRPTNNYQGTSKNDTNFDSDRQYLPDYEAATPGQTYFRTPGINIGNYEVVGVGPLCIWDTAGQIEFHVTHSMFLGSENAMAVIAYDLRGGYQEIDVSLHNQRPSELHNITRSNILIFFPSECNIVFYIKLQMLSFFRENLNTG